MIYSMQSYEVVAQIKVFLRLHYSKYLSVSNALSYGNSASTSRSSWLFVATSFMLVRGSMDCDELLLIKTKLIAR